MKMRLLVFILCCCPSLEAVAQHASLVELLPADTAGWRLTAPPRLFVGDELFRMINGGAALYQEYGFDRAISGGYEDDEGRTVDAEVYAMTDVAGAYGIFGITAAAGEQDLQLGDEGQLGEYFLVFRKGRHVVTVSGQNTDSRTMDGIQLIGKAIEARIDSGGATPHFVTLFSSLVDQRSRPVYLRGAIGVGNFYIFAPQNIFHVDEGVTGERDSTRFFVFRYPSSEQSSRNFRAAAEALRASEKYSNVISTSTHLTATDRDGNLLRASSVGSAIAVVIGGSELLVRKLGEELAKLVSRL